VRHGAAARGAAGGAGERRDRACLFVAHLVDDAVERERFVAEEERAAGDRRDQRHLVAVRQCAVGCRVLLVDRVQQPRRLVTELERAPHVRDRRRVDLALGPPGALAEPCEESHGDGHGQ